MTAHAAVQVHSRPKPIRDVFTQPAVGKTYTGSHDARLAIVAGAGAGSTAKNLSISGQRSRILVRKPSKSKNAQITSQIQDIATQRENALAQW